VQVLKSYDTSTGTTKVKTDATIGYLKALGNRQGPHVLASEFIASSLAVWFDLTVPEFSIADRIEGGWIPGMRGAYRGRPSER
jgi:hypothetical protein